MDSSKKILFNHAHSEKDLNWPNTRLKSVTQQPVWFIDSFLSGAHKEVT